MNNKEIESFIKNFLFFFTLLEIVLSLFFIEIYRSDKKDFNQNLFKSMQLCSYTLDCKKFEYDFAKKDYKKIYRLYLDKQIYSFFPIPESKKFMAKIIFPKNRYNKALSQIKKNLLIKFAFWSLALMVISLFFTFYSLKPIRDALKLNDEFVKDILHDFNTPISAMVINIKMFQKKYGSNIFIDKIGHSINTIILLQNNLRGFLDRSPTQKELINVSKIAKERVDFIKSIYPKVNFYFNKETDLIKWTNKKLLIRILDNILSNGAKYNKINGFVKVTVKKDIIIIKDSGKGIKDVKKVMQRYYKEQDRGVGLGLHIVDKFAKELNIKVKIKSKIGVGTEVILDFSKIDGNAK